MRDMETVSRPRAKTMRKAPTKAEAVLWTRLKGQGLCGLKFRRQHPIGSYVADFACLPAMLVVEVDGGTHITPDQLAHDRRRTAFLAEQNWDVFRVWNNDVYTNLHAVPEGIGIRALDRIAAIGENTPSGPSGHLPRERGRTAAATDAMP